MSLAPELDVWPCVRVGRTRTLHLVRVDIEDGRVVLYTRCNLPLTTGEWTGNRITIPTCTTCTKDLP